MQPFDIVVESLYQNQPINYMNFISKISLSLLLASTLFASCNNNKNSAPQPQPEPKPKTAQEMLTAKSWKMTAGTAKTVFMGQTSNQDIMAMMESCEKDNIEKYLANGNFTNDEGATKCDPADPQTFDSGTWQLLENNTKLKRIYGANDTETLDVISLSETTMKLRMKTTEMVSNPANPNQKLPMEITAEFTMTAQ